MEIKRVVVGLLQTNAYIISSNKKGVIIDPGDEEDKILSFTKSISIKYILLTHNHPDHIEAVGALKQILGVKCGIHPLDKTKVGLEGILSKSDKSRLFDFEFNDGDEIKFGDVENSDLSESLQVIHTPGHTPGSCCFLMGDALFSGDTLFYCGYGRTDLPGGNETDLFKSIENLLKLSPATKVYPGHGPPTTIANERKYY